MKYTITPEIIQDMGASWTAALVEVKGKIIKPCWTIEEAIKYCLDNMKKEDTLEIKWKPLLWGCYGWK